MESRRDYGYRTKPNQPTSPNVGNNMARWTRSVVVLPNIKGSNNGFGRKHPASSPCSPPCAAHAELPLPVRSRPVHHSTAWVHTKRSSRDVHTSSSSWSCRPVACHSWARRSESLDAWQPCPCGWARHAGRLYNSLVSCMHGLRDQLRNDVDNVVDNVVIAGAGYGGYLTNCTQGHPGARHSRVLITAAYPGPER
ncbi:hypothetical protein F4777DRAFT_576408 [Nemania sp. FL0916]|nr:hypothetical protein F4777DRAFT_576408 [Nemania sp. FL0916]